MEVLSTEKDVVGSQTLRNAAGAFVEQLTAWTHPPMPA